MKKTIIEFIGSLAEGGAETLVKDYSILLTEHGYNVIVLVLHAEEVTVNFQVLKQNDIQIVRVYKNWNLATRMINKIFGKYIVSRKFMQLIENNNTASIHIHLALLHYLLPIRRKLSNINLLYTCHNEPRKYFEGKNISEARAARVLIRDNNLQLIALHEQMRDELKDRFNTDNVVVIRNGVDFRRFRGNNEDKKIIRKDIGIPDAAFVLGHIGRFCVQKNHEFLVEIFKRVKDERPDAFLLLIGTGPLREKIELKLKAYGLEDSCLILSHRSDIPRLLHAMDIFVFPSLYEGLSVTLVEAQASGLPCLISDRVNQETVLLETTYSLSLTDSIEKWKDAIIEPKINKNYSDISLFDIQKEILILEQLYIK